MTDYSGIMIAQNSFAPTASGFSARQTGDRLTPRKTLAMHHESRDFLERELRRMPDPLGIGGAWEKTVVVTHHAPSALSLAGKKAVGHGSAAYASHLEYLVTEADVWVHGHTHVPADYQIGSGRVLCNPRGYAENRLVRGFNPDFVVEI